MLYQGDFPAIRLDQAGDVAGCAGYGAQESRKPHPEIAGQRVRIPGTIPIYLIDRNGYRRCVPFPLTFLNLFGDCTTFSGIMVAEDVADIAEGFPLDERAILVRGATSEAIYLMDRGTKKLISSSQVMSKYGFDERSVICVPQVLIDSIPAGEVWE
jgi:hypothetical protein